MKSNKALKLGVLVLSLGALAACGGTGDDNTTGGDKPGDATHEHVAATDWQQSATKHWHKCTDTTCKQKLDEAAHDFGEAYDVVAATCTTAGSSKQKCKVCNYVKTNTDPEKGHTYAKDADGNDVVTWTSRADCENAGAGTKTCTVCAAVENVTEPALTHEYAKDADGNDIVTWTKEANCTEAGEGSKVCKRDGCDHVEPVTMQALGHDLELVGGATQAEEGKATVNLYRCKRDCGTEYLGFKATEVTTASMATLYKVKNGDLEGYRFFGHPIGNDVALDDTGSADQNNHPAVYNKDQKGDFFEYVFDLNAEQAASLSNCKLYCKATPSDWMQSSNVDFWKVKGDAASDWTYGMYIDDAHPATDNGDGTFTGVVVEDFRYVLYVDDVLQTMDSTIDTPSGANGSVGEYVVPFTFHLKEGTNKIKLVMSGGYRSVFYEFTFRPCEAEPEHTHTFAAGEKIGTSALRPVACTGESCTETMGYELQAADATEGQKNPDIRNDNTAKNTRLGKGEIFSDKWNISGIGAGTYDVYLNAAASSNNSSAYWNADEAMKNGGTEGNNGGADLCHEFRYKIKIDNGEPVNVGGATDKYSDYGMKENTASWTTKAVCTITIPENATVLDLYNMNNGYSIWVSGVRLVPATNA